MLNRLGHSISYDEVERVDTALAQSQMDEAARNEVTIPTNIRPGTFVHAASDNNDVIEGTLDGRNTTHSTALVFYQRKEDTVEALFDRGSMRMTTVRARSLKTLPKTMDIDDFNRVGQRPSPTSMLGKVDRTWFRHIRPSTKEDVETNAKRNLDCAWMLTRLLPRKLFKVDLDVA